MASYEDLLKRRRQPDPATEVDTYGGYDDRVQSFLDLAKQYGLAPRDLASIVTTNVSPEMQFEHVYREFEKDVVGAYGDVDTLDDPQDRALMFEAWQTRRKFDSWRQTWPVHLGPETLLKSVALPELASHAMSEVFSSLFQIYGDQYTAIALETALNRDPAQRAETWRILEEISGRSLAVLSPRAPGVGGLPSPGIDPEALLTRVLADADAFDSMTLSEQYAVVGFSRSVLAEEEAVTALVETDIAGQAATAKDVFMEARGARIVLDEGERQRLKTLVSGLETNEDYSLRDADFFTTDVDVSERVGDLGLVGFRDPAHTPTFTFDPEWVKQNFAKHAGVVRFLTDRYPDARFVYAEAPGAIGKVFALLNRGTDNISAYVGAGFEQFNELGERTRGYSESDRLYWSNEAARIQKSIEDGKVPEAEFDQAVSQMMHARDLSSDDVGFGAYMATGRERADPADFGTGFGDSVVSAFGIYPGDKEYSTVHGIGTLVGQIAFDPTILLAKPIKAIKLAGVVPEGAVVSKSAITQTLFDFMAMPPEALLASRRGSRLMGRLSSVSKTFDDVDAFATHLHKVLPIDRDTAFRIAESARIGGNHMHATAISAFAGEGGKAVTEAYTLGHVEDASEFLRLVDEVLPASLADAKALVSKLRRRKGANALWDEGEAVVPARDLVDLTAFPEKTMTLSNRTARQMTSLRNSMERRGYDPTLKPRGSKTPVGPIEIQYHPGSGKTIIQEGHHRIGIAAQLGLDVPVRVKVVTRVSQLGPAEQVRDMTDAVRTAFMSPELREAYQRMLGIETDLAVRLAGREHALADKFYWESVNRGADFEPIRPLRRLPSTTTIRKLGPADTKFGRVWEAATAGIKTMPMDVLERLSVSDAATMLRSNPKIDTGVRHFMASLRRWGQDTGTGQRLWFETSLLPEGMLADEAVDKSYRALRDFGVFIGAREDVIDDMLTGIAKAARKGSRTELYSEFVEGYQKMLRSSTLDPLGRNALSDMWPEMLGERAAGYVREGRGAHVKSVPTVSIPIVDDAGNVTLSGVPIVEADMLRGFTLPTHAAIRDHIGMLRGYLRGVQQTGGRTGRTVASTYFTLGQLWRGFNAVWARGVLLFRMPSALPLRIQLEQMVRIEAFGFSSLVRHPAEWWKSVRGVGEFGLVGESPAAALGVMMRDSLDDPVRRLARRGRQTLNLTQDPEATVKALAGRMKAYASSPSTKRLLAKGTNKQVVTAFQESEFLWKTFGPLWDDVVAKNIASGGKLTSYEKIVLNIRKEMNQIIGTGPGAERVRAAILSGRMHVRGKEVSIIKKEKTDIRTGRVLTEDGNKFADELLQMYNEGTWKPDVYEFPRSWGDYIPASQDTILGGLARASDWAFRNFYARPDLYFGRSPLFRQIAAREYSRLRRLGWSQDRAKDAARVFGARQTADVLFTIGANSSADYFLRSFMPFFPAWKELAETWLVKIPREVGGGGLTGWAVGAPAVASRIEAWVDFFESQDIVYKDGGQWRVRFGVMSPLVRAITGLDVDNVSFSADSIVSLLPVPSLDDDDPFWKGMMPTVGAPTGNILALLNDKFGGVFGDLEEQLTLFGGNQSLGPSSVDYLAEAFGITLPWMNGQTEKMHDFRRYSAFVDAFRLKYAEMYDTRPVEANFKSEKKFIEADVAWLEDVYLEADRGARNWYLLRSISSVFLPFSIKYDTDAAQETTAIWNVINGIQDAGDETGLTTPLLEGMRDTYPELELYLTGKTTPLVGDNPERVDSFEAFFEEIEEGKRLDFGQEQWVVWALGNQEAALHRSILNETFSKFADTPQAWLLSGFETAEELRDETIRWDGYLRQSRILAEHLDVRDKAGHPTSFAVMYKNFYEAKQNRYSTTKGVRLSLEQEYAVEANEALSALARFFGAGKYTDDAYLDVKRTLTDIEDRIYEESKDPVFQAIGWWWGEIQPYFDTKDEIWRKIDATPSSARGPLYRQLAELENEWSEKDITHPTWGDMPQVQEVMFQKLSPVAQKLRQYGWAKLPVEFLSRYQRQKLYGKSRRDAQLDELVGRIGENERLFESVVDVNAISTSSLEYDALRAETDRKNTADARDLGVENVYQTWQRPAYRRIGTLIDNQYWDHVVSFVDAGRRFLETAEVSPRGGTAAAVEYQRRTVALVEGLRGQDEEFGRIIEALEIAYGEGADKPAVGIDLYWALFFDGFGTAPGYLNYY